MIGDVAPYATGFVAVALAAVLAGWRSGLVAMIAGQALFRRLAWWSHTRMTLRIIRRLKKRGYTVYAGGDLNTPVGVSGYKGVLNEAGRKYDRLGSTRELTDAKRMSRLGSDHFRLRATAK